MAKTKARVRAFWLSVCPETGDPGCMDCIEGMCAGFNRWVKTRAHECTECSGSDVYGEMYHDETCSLYVAPVMETN